jgi:hypothetical protein
MATDSGSAAAPVPGLGRRRLGLLLSTLSGAVCAVMMVLVLLVYGTPFNPLWWAVMAAILAAAAAGPWMLLPAVDWVIDGYRRDDRQA